LIPTVRVYYAPNSYFVADVLISGGGTTAVSVDLTEVKSGNAKLTINQATGMAEALKSGEIWIVNETAAEKLGIRAGETLQSQKIIPMVNVIGGNDAGIERQFRNNGIEVVPRGVGRLGRLRGGIEVP
jgi:hypothetical protein